MIATLHTEEFSCFAGLNHMARQGETLIVGPKGFDADDNRVGTFEIVRVVHTVGSGRVDLYAVRVGEARGKRDWASIMDHEPVVAMGEENER